MYQIETIRKHVMHHDRVRSCPSSDIPIWLRRRRQKLFEEDGNQLDESAEITLGIFLLRGWVIFFVFYFGGNRY